MSERKTRRKWTSTEKLRIVMAGLDRGTNLSELCRQEGINLTQYYTWKKQLESSAKEVFEKKTTRKEEQLVCGKASGTTPSRDVVADGG